MIFASAAKRNMSVLLFWIMVTINFELDKFLLAHLLTKMVLVLSWTKNFLVTINRRVGL